MRSKEQAGQAKQVKPKKEKAQTKIKVKELEKNLVKEDRIKKLMN